MPTRPPRLGREGNSCYEGDIEGPRTILFFFFFLWTDVQMSVLFYTFFKGFYLFIFRDRESEGERERNINVWLTLTLTRLGTWPATQASALTGN